MSTAEITTTAEITEIRCYNRGLEGAPELALVFAFHSPENPTHNDLVGQVYSRACGRFAGVEYVVDAHGPFEDVTDWDGNCPAAERFRSEASEDSGTWARELAMEAGMLHGIDAYNDMMGS